MQQNKTDNCGSGIECVECNAGIIGQNVGTTENPLCEACFKKMAEDYAEPSTRKSDEAPTWLLITGYIFSILIGLIGMCIGFQIIRKEKINGESVNRYDKRSRMHGWIMMFVSFISMFTAKILNIF